MKLKLTVFLASALAAILLTGCTSNISNSKKAPDAEGTGDSRESSLVYFHGDGCPHCANVEEFVEANKVQEAIPFSSKEVYYNKDNAREFQKVAADCGLNPAGVPLLWNKETNECISGDTPIISFFQDRLNQQ